LQEEVTIMHRRIQAWGLAVALLLGGLGTAWPAAAQTGGLPTVKPPPSARFDISGSITAHTVGNSLAPGDLTVAISGSGAQVGTNLQEDVTIALTLPAIPGLTDPSAPSTPISITTSTILVDGKSYTRIGGLGGATGADQWYATDLSTLPGGGANMENPLGSLIGVDPAMAAQYATAFTVQPLGQETISGGATTKYQVDVDLPKLYAAMGVTQTEETTQLLQNSTLVMTMWVGDNDQYLYQIQTRLNSQVTDPEDNSTTRLAMDLRITYRDFGAAITITAPANAVPLDLSGTTEGATGLPGLLGVAVPGMPTTAPLPGMPSVLPVPASAPPATPMPGMPRSGLPDAGGAAGLLALALLCVSGGVLARQPH
jgi:hypothetical protein